MNKKLFLLKALVLSMFLLFMTTSYAQSLSYQDLALEVKKVAAQKGNSQSNNTQPSAAKLAGACDLAIPITSGNIIGQPLVCGNENLLNSTTVGTFCTTDANTPGSPIIPNYGNGNEATYTYKPSTNGTATIKVYDTNWTAIFVYKGCPVAGGTCVAATRNLGNTRTLNFNVEAGVEYFIWIDTFPEPISPCVEGGKLTFSGPEPIVNNPDCEQGNNSNNFENGFNILNNDPFRIADDFKVAPNNTLNVKSITLNLFSTEPISSLDLNFYADDNGKPGTVVQSVTSLTPYAQVLIGTNFGFMVYAVLVDVNLSFTGGTTGATYWMQPSAHANNPVYWEISTVGTLGHEVVASENNGPWETDPENVGAQAVFKLHCDHATPPEEVCLLDFGYSVEPITRVKIADIDNTSSAEIDGTPAVEDFTTINVHLNIGSQYPIALEGNTAGDWTDFFTVFIDWNQNGKYNDPGEMYEIGKLTNSTGTDGKQAIGSITVPATATLGSTKMLVLKNWDTSPVNPCMPYDFGQAEEYSVAVAPSLGINEISSNKLSAYPNPVKDLLTIKSTKKVTNISVFGLTGQRIITNIKIKDGTINLSSLSKGAYIIMVHLEGDEVKTFKIIKE